MTSDLAGIVLVGKGRGGGRMGNNQNGARRKSKKMKELE